jgi:DNA-binding transcriptional LysR family regulator
MHLKSLNVFCDVVARRSFSRAAAENGISQSGVSQVVHQLERRLGVRLIDRSKRPFVLTSEGQTFYEGCREIVDRYSELESDVRSLHEQVAGRVVVASIYSAGLYQMNHCLKVFLTRYPRANVRLEYHHPDCVYDLVDSDRADLGLVSYPKGSRTVRTIPWLEEPMVLVCAASHRLARRGAIRLEELCGCDVVAFVRELKIRREIDRSLAAARADVRVVMEFDNIETIKRAIEIDAGVSLLPEPTVRREVATGTLHAVPIADRCLVRPLGILHRRGKPLGRTARRLVKLLQASAETFLAGNGDSADGPLDPPLRNL